MTAKTLWAIALIDKRSCEVSTKRYKTKEEAQEAADNINDQIPYALSSGYVARAIRVKK